MMTLKDEKGEFIEQCARTLEEIESVQRLGAIATLSKCRDKAHMIGAQDVDLNDLLNKEVDKYDKDFTVSFFAFLSFKSCIKSLTMNEEFETVYSEITSRLGSNRECLMKLNTLKVFVNSLENCEELLR